MLPPPNSITQAKVVRKRKWVPAFATDQVRGLRAHGKDEGGRLGIESSESP